MANSSQNRAFQAYNSHNYKNRPAVHKPPPLSFPGETQALGRLPYSPSKRLADFSNRTPPPASPSSPRSPSKDSGKNSTPWTTKRRLSAASLSNLLPNRKGLPMTALATNRQNLWMSIAKNPSSQPTLEETSITLRRQIEPPSLLRKKLLRLVLVFSYLLSISLFAIALATFYGFFWTGYETNVALTTPTEAIWTSTGNASLIDAEDVSQRLLLLSSNFPRR